ncbi:MAG TPA: hypothetical protein VGF08_12130, partial [Terriglobales bacterium]
FSMVILAALVHLPRPWLAALSIAVIAAHNLFDKVDSRHFGSAAWIWDILHQLAPFRVLGNTVVAAYSLVPWFAVMALGYCGGPIMSWAPERRRSFLLRLGIFLTAAFVVLRAVNVYGDPVRWSMQHSSVFTALSFLNANKYPPSLIFLLMTLGPALLIMVWLEKTQLSNHNPLVVFGRVPFFFFLVHLAVIHSVAILLALLRYGPAPFLLKPPPSMGSPAQLFPPGYGYSLWVVYLVWIAVVAALYPMCRWFAAVKQRRRDWWLSYL